MNRAEIAATELYDRGFIVHPHLHFAADMLKPLAQAQPMADWLWTAVHRLHAAGDSCYPELIEAAFSPVVYTQQADRSFIAGDLVTGRTCYAYPGSDHALQAAKGAGRKVAQEMVDAENNAGEWRNSVLAQDYDARNWERLFQAADKEVCPACQEQPGKYHSCNGGWGPQFPPVASNHQWAQWRKEDEEKTAQALPRMLTIA